MKPQESLLDSQVVWLPVCQVDLEGVVQVRGQETAIFSQTRIGTV